MPWDEPKFLYNIFSIFCNTIWFVQSTEMNNVALREVFCYHQNPESKKTTCLWSMLCCWSCGEKNPPGCHPGCDMDTDQLVCAGQLCELENPNMSCLQVPGFVPESVKMCLTKYSLLHPKNGLTLNEWILKNVLYINELLLLLRTLFGDSQSALLLICRSLIFYNIYSTGKLSSLKLSSW